MIRALLLGLLPAVLAAVDVEAPFARATAPGQTVGGVFLTLANPGGPANALVAASCPRAGRVELHTHETGPDGVARMHPVPRIDLPADGTVSLAPGGFHLMLFDLDAPLVEGTTLALTLTFADQSTATVAVPVRWAGATAATDGDVPPCCR